MLTLSDGRPDGAVSADGRVMGCYMHGLFASDTYRSSWLASSTGEGNISSGVRFEAVVEEGLEALADHLEAHADIGAIAKIAGVRE
jgi:adenosylcobyric acid synthase